MSFAGSIQMIFFSMLTCTIGSQGGPNKMAAANFLWLHFLNNRSSIQSFFEIIAFKSPETRVMLPENHGHFARNSWSCRPTIRGYLHVNAPTTDDSGDR